MKSRYLNSDPLPWLTDGEDPAVTYLAKRELLGEDEEKIYSELTSSKLADYFRKNSSDGIMGDMKHPDLFKKGALWFFLLAAESGFRHSEEFVKNTADFICGKYQINDGSFCFSAERAFPSGCRSGNILYALLKSGIRNERTEKGLSWIKENQRHDGGWLSCPVAGRCGVLKLVLFNSRGSSHKLERDIKTPSCPVASYFALKTLAESGETQSPETLRGIEFLVSNGFFLNSGYRLHCGAGHDFNSPGYPVMFQYDYLSTLVLVSSLKRDPSLFDGSLFNSVIKAQNSDGTWDSLNIHDGMIRDKGKSRWVTLNALRFIKNTSEE